jgi:mRNA interferase RelE/StbE
LDVTQLPGVGFAPLGALTAAQAFHLFLCPPVFQHAPDHFRNISIDLWPDNGYSMAIMMMYRIVVAPEAQQALHSLPAFQRAAVRDAIDRHLLHQPALESKSRIKRLRGVERPQYRLRVGTIRVFYDITDEEVHVLAIVEKSKAAEWLAEQGDKP